MAERLVGGDPEQPRPQSRLVAKGAAVVERREEAVGDDVLRGRSVADDEVGDGLHVAAVSGEQVGQHLGASPTECLHRHPILPAVSTAMVARRCLRRYWVDTGRQRFG